MSQTADQMELREEDIAKHLDVLVFGAAFDQLRRV